jgi:hypothetical protein
MLIQKCYGMCQQFLSNCNSLLKCIYRDPVFFKSHKLLNFIHVHITKYCTTKQDRLELQVDAC